MAQPAPDHNPANGRYSLEVAGIFARTVPKKRNYLTRRHENKICLREKNVTVDESFFWRTSLEMKLRQMASAVKKKSKKLEGRNILSHSQSEAVIR